MVLWWHCHNTLPKSGQQHIFLWVCPCKQNVEPIFMKIRIIIQGVYLLYRNKRESKHRNAQYGWHTFWCQAPKQKHSLMVGVEVLVNNFSKVLCWYGSGRECWGQPKLEETLPLLLLQEFIKDVIVALYMCISFRSEILEKYEHSSVQNFSIMKCSSPAPRVACSCPLLSAISNHQDQASVFHSIQVDANHSNHEIGPSSSSPSNEFEDPHSWLYDCWSLCGCWCVQGLGRWWWWGKESAMWQVTLNLITTLSMHLQHVLYPYPPHYCSE